MNLLPTSSDALAAFFALFSLFFGWMFGGFGIPVAPPTTSGEASAQLNQVIWGKDDVKDLVPGVPPTVSPRP